LHSAAGGGVRAPSFFSVDADINRNTWYGVALQWFRGINSVLGVQRTGVYGVIGRAAHGVLQSADPATGLELSAARAAQAAAEGVLGTSRQAAYQRFGKR
jgi:hypothetical protein